MTNCWYCGTEMIWQSDFNYDEVFMEGEGIVSILICPKCGAEAQFSIRDDDPEQVQPSDDDKPDNNGSET